VKNAEFGVLSTSWAERGLLPVERSLDSARPPLHCAVTFPLASVNLQIVTFEDDLAADFERLNRAWIERYFSVEATDRAMFENPRAAVLEPGGQIFFAKVNGAAVGVCAAQKLSGTEWELAKLGVDERFQGLGLGRMLCERTIEYCWEKQATRVVIESNRLLSAALNLYRKLGFKEFIPEFTSPFTRADVFLELPRGENHVART